MAKQPKSTRTKLVQAPAGQGAEAGDDELAEVASTVEGAAAGGISFPVVGIGASAGGLEALEQFLGHVPEHSGMAFVVIQHLDPTQKGMLPELLQRATGMLVIQARNRLKVKPDTVYVIPPNADMSILHGSLYLFEPEAPRGLRLPIDFFLRSLAQDRREASIGVILSGMGSDGSLGLRAIKEMAGLTLAQDPANARFDGMPKSAIDAGLVDLIAPAAELPARLVASLRAGARMVNLEAEPDSQSQSALEQIVILLRSQTGQDFSLYKKSTVYRRIERRMGIHQIDKIATYVRYLRENSQELELLFRELLIGVTNFFRDRLPGRCSRPRSCRPCSTAARPAPPCAPECRPVPPGKRRTPWPWCSARRWNWRSRKAASPCRFSLPTSTRTPSTRRARGTTRRTSAPT